MNTTTFLTFVGNQCGKAEEAIHFYTSIFPNSRIERITKYTDGEPGGTPELIKIGVFTLNGVKYMISENNYNHAWSVTPGVSIFIESHSDEVIQELFDLLSSNGGQVMVPLDNYQDGGDYGFGKKFGWCEDKYGISWQLNLSKNNINE
ncbi:VOC family protein [Tenacibaculum xiamenense]|uniref:VOC family protein n=1 Tax=Tenacibaculum xiamenense TaxID=1261553 RepID=UPI003893E0FD